MDTSDEIVDLLERVSAQLDRIESEIETVAEANRSLEVQVAVMTEDLAQIRRDIDRLEPGVI